jgi:hypothetical protein
MTIVNPVSYLHNRADHTAQTDRLGLNALLMGGPATSPPSWRQGALGASDFKVVAQATPNMTVAVGGGQAFVNQAAAIGGAYAVTNDAPVNVTITAAHASLPRRDLVILRVEDSFYTGAVNQGSLQVITGTASSTPTDPAVTGNYIVLARVTVAAAATSITNGAITDLRPRTNAVGGSIWIATTAERDALTNVGSGQIVYVSQTDSYYGRNAAGKWAPLAEETGLLALAFGSGWTDLNGAEPGQYERTNGMVTVYLSVNKGSASAAGETIATLPVGFRPIRQIRGLANNAGAGRPFTIGTNGVISNDVAQNAGLAAMVGSIVFPAVLP